MDIKRKMCFRVTDENTLCTPIYKHMLKIRTNYGSTDKWLVFELLTPKKSTYFTLESFQQFLHDNYDDLYVCQATGNIVDANNVTTGICELYANNTRNWMGFNSSNAQFFFYVQELDDTVQEVK